MSVNDPIGDLITAIRNGQQARLAAITVPASNLRGAVLDILQKEGYIRTFAKEEVRAGISQFVVELKYVDGKAAIKTLNRVSKPGRRVYKGTKEMPRFYNGLGISILSTSQGVMTDQDARLKRVGGEVLCSVF